MSTTTLRVNAFKIVNFVNTPDRLKVYLATVETDLKAAYCNFNAQNSSGSSRSYFYFQYFYDVYPTKLYGLFIINTNSPSRSVN